MSTPDELFAIADEMERASDSRALKDADEGINALEEVAKRAGRAFSGSWLGYHSRVYYRDLQPPPPGARFSQEWGLQDLFGDFGTRGEWQEFDPDALHKHLRHSAGDPDLSEVKFEATEAGRAFERSKANAVSILMTEQSVKPDPFLSKLLEEIESLEILSTSTVAQMWSPKGQIMTRDSTAMGQGIQLPTHVFMQAEIASLKHSFGACRALADACRKAASHIGRQARTNRREARIGTNVFIGHGRSHAWRELKDFISERLRLPWDEFNRVPVAGVTNQARLAEMLDAAAIAFIIMTAEDEMADGEMQARMNVIHEAGLFQGRLGFTKAIVLLEEGCQEFSNIQGLGQVRFPKGKISACFEEIRFVLERERLIGTDETGRIE